VWYLPDWDTVETSTTVTMDGTTNVALPACVIINRMEVMTKGASGPNVGIIKATADTDGTISSQIRAGQGQTQQSVFGFASTQTLYLCNMYSYANKAGGASGLVDMTLLYNGEPDTELTKFVTKFTMGMQTVGLSGSNHGWCLPRSFDGPAIIKIGCVSGTNDMDISAGFSGYLLNDTW
jgi:hypothetical protein